MNRVEAIDQYRGFVIALMVVANYMNNVQVIPAWLKHANDVGFTVIDLVAPMFIFAMGLVYGLSFRSRFTRQGAWKTYEHFISRNLALLGLGYAITLVWQLSGIHPPSVNWGLLQALGTAGLITLPFIRLPPLWRWGIGLSMLAAYQLLLDRFWLIAVLEAPHNGPWGALSWGGMLILATALADIYHDERLAGKIYPLISGALVAAGSALAIIVPISKDRASASYILVSLGLSSLVFFGFHLLQSRWGARSPTLTAWGRNPLFLYLLHYVLLGLFLLPPLMSWYIAAPLWLVIIQLVVIFAALSWVGSYLNRRKLYFVL